MKQNQATGEHIPETIKEVSNLLHDAKDVQYSKRDGVIEWYRRDAVDQLVYDAYCAGQNFVDPTKPDGSGYGQSTLLGDLALKAALWCKHVGTR